MVKVLRTALATVLAVGLAGVTPASASDPPPEACRSGAADAARCEAIYDGGYRMTCFRNGEPVFEGDVWLIRQKDQDPLPYVRANGKPVEPLWERYGACKIRREP